MRYYKFFQLTLYTLAISWLFSGMAYPEEGAPPKECFESRKGYTNVKVKEVKDGLPNVKCSKTTGGVLWWGDPFDDTISMGDMPVEADYSHEEAVVKPREKQLKFYALCTLACHNGVTVPVPKDIKPRLLKFHLDLVPNSLELKHGKGAIWCLNCHSATNRSKLINHFGEEISFNQPQKLCGKCHGQIYRDWREGIHGKRIGMWVKGGKKRWWVCTECHNPHDVEQGNRKSGFAQIAPEPPPVLPKGMVDAKHETLHEVHETGKTAEQNPH